MKIRLYTIEGYYWLGLKLGTKLFLICRKGKVDDCIQP